MSYRRRPWRPASSALQLPGQLPKTRPRVGGSGGAASEEFLLPLAVGVGVELAAGDPSVRRILQRHRCRLDLLDQPQSLSSLSLQPPPDPLSVAVLRRHRVRVSGAEATSVRRCCRQLAASFPAFAHRTPLRGVEGGGGGGGGGDDTAAATGSAVVADARLSLLCRRKCKLCRPCHPGQLLHQHPALKSILRAGSGSYSLKLVPNTSSPNAAGRGLAIDDNYSIYFTDNGSSRSAQLEAVEAAPSVATTVRSRHSNRRLFEERSSDSCSITCTTVTISIGDTRCGVCCADKAVGPDERWGNRRIAEVMRSKSSSSRSTSNNNRRRRHHRVTDRGVQTSPRLVKSAADEQVVVPSGNALDWYEVASAAAKPGCQRAPKLVNKQKSTSVAAASSEPARRSRQRPLLSPLLSNQGATGGLRSAHQKRRLRGFVAHRRVTWYLRSRPRRSK